MYVDDDGGVGYSTDQREALKLESFVPAPSGDDRPWYERVAEYGLTRAIDNQVGPPASNKTSAPATFAGQDGRTYSQVGNSGTAAPKSNSQMLLILGLAAAAVVAVLAFR